MASDIPWIPNRLVACGRSTIDCTYSNGVVEADPDIAGVGVLISFILASAITFVAIVVSYFTYSVDPLLLNEFDAAAIQSVRQFSRKLLRRQNKIELSLANRKIRNEALTKFVLALSDQQLVTGLAILITGYYQRCSISGYHFVLVANLAWFSSTTHLSTLAVLQQYLVEHPFLKVCRVVGMICLLGMLFHAQLHTQWLTIYSLPVQCTFIMGFPALSDAADYGLMQLINAIIWAGVLIFLFFAYGNRIVRLFASPPASSIFSWMEQCLRKVLGLELRRRKVARTASMSAREGKSRISVFITGLRERLDSLMTFWNGFINSFLWEIVWMIFGNTFGVAQVWAVRWETNGADDDSPTAYSVNGSENTMGFGQLVAILLIALPLLAAAQVYFDVQDVRVSEIDPTSTVDPISTEPASLTQHNIPSGGRILLFAMAVACILIFFAFEAVYSWLYPEDSSVLVAGVFIFIIAGFLVIQSIARVVTIIIDFKRLKHHKKERSLPQTQP